MSNEELSAKETYFRDQDLLDVSDDEQYEAGESSKVIERSLAESKAMPPPSLMRYSSSFLGPTPKEKQASFEAHTKRQRATTREDAQKLESSTTAPEPGLAQSFPMNKPRLEPPGARVTRGSKLKRTSSLPGLPVPFYQRMGDIPREIGHGKKVGLALNIKVRPERTQLLKEKIVYFYPNDDISGARRRRIHKVIELGAAWVKSWRDDITHIILDDEAVTYDHILTHLRKGHPYVTDSINLGQLQDLNRRRFRVKGAPPVQEAIEVVEATQISTTSQTSLKIKPSRRQVAARESQKTNSHPNDESPFSKQSAVEMPAPVFDDIVEDSFIMPSPEPTKARPEDHFNDALSLAIQEAKAIAHLPLDEDDDESPTIANTTEVEDDSGTDDEAAKSAPKHPKKLNFLSKASALRDKGSLNLSAFQCMDPGASNYNSENPNARTIQILQEMCKHYDQMQDSWRTLAYRKGITTLKKQTIKITTAKQAIALPTIGPRLADKIEEIVLTDRLRKLDNTRDDPLDAVLRLFLGVYGAGLVQANKWIQAGHRTLSDLSTKAKLTDSQKIGVQHYKDFNSRIPRAEVEAHGAFVKDALHTINPAFQATIMGSYRRGAHDAGDIDMIVTCPSTPLTTLQSTVFSTLVPHLFAANFLKASLATSRSHDPTGSKWHGASCLPGSSTWRRLDLLVVPEQEMGAALIYFTGNDIFNRSIRLLARKKGMRLNQRGLYRDVKRGLKGGRLNEGVLVEGRCEKRIFEVLGVPWREPHERIC
ncbi:hypothetical protein T440DRAFT_438817 [Plenodomus tracheiphilus IPT5]|uniref:DNA-directed DNA polymerase n=1 Tax=Plenodomus tracheiphilus IPT5 TaxID=1408161 RepID=A0A6A7BLR6_9PLEO|nr:hypothetical protein T440DRAFT_438817 [Plenodomus tracheiphilus IPT5]